MATDYFLKLDGVPGDSLDKAHRSEIDVLSYSWGVDQAGQAGHVGGGVGAGKTTFRDFSFQMRVGQASPVLFQACASGKHFPAAVLSVRKAGERPLDYLTIRFTDVLITSFEQASAEDAPTELVAFEFAKVELTYTPQDARGGPGPASKAGWDLTQNAKI